VDRILFDLKANCRHLRDTLSEHFEMVPFLPQNALTECPAREDALWRFAGRDYLLPVRATIEGHWPSIAGAVALVQALEPKPVACVLWNTCTPMHVACALACRARGIPVYEINHWSISTALVGHFEDRPQADVVVCSEEYAEFAERAGWQGELLPIGQPAYDTWFPRDKKEVRARIGLEPDARYVLKTSTWLHAYNRWNDSRFYHTNELYILETLRQLQQQDADLQVIWTFRHKMSEGQKAEMGQELMQLGLKPGSVLLTDDVPIRDLVDASDLVISQKSGVAVDAVMSQRAAVTMECRPQFDEWHFRCKGFSGASDPAQLLYAAKNALAEPDFYTKEQEHFRSWWGGTHCASDMLVERVKAQ